MWWRIFALFSQIILLFNIVANISIIIFGAISSIQLVISIFIQNIVKVYTCKKMPKWQQWFVFLVILETYQQKQNYEYFILIKKILNTILEAILLILRLFYQLDLIICLVILRNLIARNKTIYLFVYEQSVTGEIKAWLAITDEDN